MNKETLDKLTIKVFGAADSPTLISHVIYYGLFGLCTYCAILRAVVAGIGIGLILHFTRTSLLIGVTLIIIAAALTQLEHTANKGA